MEKKTYRVRQLVGSLIILHEAFHPLSTGMVLRTVPRLRDSRMWLSLIAEQDDKQSLPWGIQKQELCNILREWRVPPFAAPSGHVVCAEQDQACHIDDVLTTHAQRSIHRVNLQFRTHNSIKETVTPFQHHTTGTNTPGFCNAIQYRIGGISKYVKRRRKIGAVSNPEILDSEACSCIESFYGSKTKNVRNLIP